MRPTVVVLLVSCILYAGVAHAGDRYDFRKSDAYTKLSKEDRAKLEQVHRDFMMLWGALDRFADSHDGIPPVALTQLVPYFLGDLPTDPFATLQTAEEKDTKPYEISKGGWGYRYRTGSPGNRAWILASVGLPGFPYLAARDNVGLYVGKGCSISGINPGPIFEIDQGSTGGANAPSFVEVNAVDTAQKITGTARRKKREWTVGGEIPITFVTANPN